MDWFKFKPWFHTLWPSSTHASYFNRQDLTCLTSPFNFLWRPSTPVTPHVYIFIQLEDLKPTAQALLKAVSASIFFHRLVPCKSFIQFPSQDKFFVFCTALKLFRWSAIISEPSLAIPTSYDTCCRFAKSIAVFSLTVSLIIVLIILHPLDHMGTLHLCLCTLPLGL